MDKQSRKKQRGNIGHHNGQRYEHRTHWLADCVVKKRCKEKCKGDQQDSFVIINEKPVSAETGRTGKSTSFCQLNNKVIEGDLASLG